MGWKIAHKKDIKYLKVFLLKNEVKCVSFSSRIKPYLAKKTINPNYLSIFKNHTLLINEDFITHKIKEAILLTKYGLILPILEDSSNFKIKNPSVITILKKCSDKLFSILGTKKSVLKLQCFFNENISNVID